MTDVTVIEETAVKRTRTPNPFTAWKKAATALAKAKKASARADALAEEAQKAADKAAKAKEELPDLLKAEQEAYAALQSEVEGNQVDTDSLAEDAE